MSLPHRFLSISALIVLSAALGAAHVTDKLIVGLYAEPVAEGAPLQLLHSGTPLEVLGRRNGFVQVRLADDTRGWIESDYVTEEKPATAILLETQAKLRGANQRLAELQADGEVIGPAVTSADLPPSAREAQLRQSLEQAEARIIELEARLADVLVAEGAQQELDQLRERVRQAAQLLQEPQGVESDSLGPQHGGVVSRYRPWIIGLAAGLLGFGAGVAFIDRRIRKRYGGFRI